MLLEWYALVNLIFYIYVIISDKSKLPYIPLQDFPVKDDSWQ